MTRRHFAYTLTVAVLLVGAAAVELFAGGPIYPPVGCPPAVCPPMACPPPMCPPPGYCGPPCPPPPCKPNPLAQICEGAFKVVTGVVALPFRLVDCVIDKLSCPPRYGPPRPYCPPPMAACAPPISVPPYVLGPPPGPGYGMGMGMRPPVGFGHQPPRKFSPMAKQEKPIEITVTAGADQSFFGTYW
ncbi:MAG: hypothetical protein FJY85_10480 [Deltaproteobacteria bacterium]|nr:hypothetical protein [Deltaproteobacteria bacterium]